MHQRYRSAGPPTGDAWLDERTRHIPWQPLARHDLGFTSTEPGERPSGFRQCPWRGCKHWHPRRSSRCQNCGGRLGILGYPLRFYQGEPSAGARARGLRSKYELLHDQLAQASRQLAQLDRVAKDAERDSRDARTQAAIIEGLSPARVKLERWIEHLSEALWSIVVIRWFNRVEPYLVNAPSHQSEAGGRVYAYLVARRDQGERILVTWTQETRNWPVTDRRARRALKDALSCLNNLISSLLASRATAVVEGVSLLSTEVLAPEEELVGLELHARWNALEPQRDALARLAEELIMLDASRTVDSLLS